jgi:hypothetical protein
MYSTHQAIGRVICFLFDGWKLDSKRYTMEFTELAVGSSDSYQEQFAIVRIPLQTLLTSLGV